MKTENSAGMAELIYVSDPMCSWCWGFSSVVESIQKDFGNRLRIETVMGGLRPGTKEPLAAEMRATILHHWHEVQKASGREFNFDFDLPDDFVYDTEPPCRAVVTMRSLHPEFALGLLEALHRAFYVGNRDITQTDAIVELAVAAGADEGAFREAFESKATREATVADFMRSRSMGISGFPAVVVKNGETMQLLTYGYLAYAELKSRIEGWLGAA